MCTVQLVWTINTGTALIIIEILSKALAYLRSYNDKGRLLRSPHCVGACVSPPISNFE
jgi:hypothetical protein